MGYALNHSVVQVALHETELEVARLTEAVEGMGGSSEKPLGEMGRSGTTSLDNAIYRLVALRNRLAESEKRHENHGKEVAAAPGTGDDDDEAYRSSRIRCFV